MSNSRSDDEFFERVAALAGEWQVAAPTRLKSRVYSALMKAAAAQGPLASLPDCRNGGRQLCFWEKLVQVAPVPDTHKALNHCRVCHARLAGEYIEGAPIPWQGCPYADFQK